MKRCLCLGLYLTLNLSILAVNASAADKTARLLARLSLQDGSIVEFYSPMAGEIVIFQDRQADRQHDTKSRTSAHNALDIQFMEGLTPVEMYQLLSGEEDVPAALREAQNQGVQRSAQFRESDEPLPKRWHEKSVQSDTQQNDEEQRFVKSLCLPGGCPEPPVGSGEWFRKYHCGWSDAFCTCQTNRTGSGAIVKKSQEMHSTVYPYRGTVTHKLEYRSCGFLGLFCSYHHNITRDVAQGWVSHIKAWGSDRHRRASMLNADADGFHWSVYTYSTLGCSTSAGYPCACGS